MKDPADFYKESLVGNKNEIHQVGWRDEEKALKRYKYASKLLGTQHIIVDIGCGLGTLSKYVTCNRYVGLDVVDDYIQEAKARYPQHTFVNCSVYTYEPPLNKAAYVSLGAYTYVGIQDIGAFLKRMTDDIEYAVQMESPLIIVNGFHNYVTRTNPTLYYHDFNNLAEYACKYNQDYDCSIHIFEKYEFFLVLTRKKI